MVLMIEHEIINIVLEIQIETEFSQKNTFTTFYTFISASEPYVNVNIYKCNEFIPSYKYMYMVRKCRYFSTLSRINYQIPRTTYSIKNIITM